MRSAATWLASGFIDARRATIVRIGFTDTVDVAVTTVEWFCRILTCMTLLMLMRIGLMHIQAIYDQEVERERLDVDEGVSSGALLLFNPNDADISCFNCT